eukprot:gene5053-8648_t
MSSVDKKNEGNEFFKAKNYKKAIEAYTKGLISEDKNDIDHILLTNRSSCYFAEKHFLLAIFDAKEALKINEKWKKGYIRLGEAQIQFGAKKSAKETFQKGLELFPKDEALTKYYESLKYSNVENSILKLNDYEVKEFFFMIFALQKHILENTNVLPNVSFKDLPQLDNTVKVMLNEYIWSHRNDVLEPIIENEQPKAIWNEILPLWNQKIVQGEFWVLSVSYYGALLYDEKTKKVYLIQSLHDPIRKVIPQIPMHLTATLLPWKYNGKNIILYDGLFKFTGQQPKMKFDPQVVISEAIRKNEIIYQFDFKKCWNCGNVEKDIKFKLCGSCKIARYCSENCQKSHWKSDHKFTCKTSSSEPKPQKKPSYKASDFYFGYFSNQFQIALKTDFDKFKKLDEDLLSKKIMESLGFERVSLTYSYWNGTPEEGKTKLLKAGMEMHPELSYQNGKEEDNRTTFEKLEDIGNIPEDQVQYIVQDMLSRGDVSETEVQQFLKFYQSVKK